MSRSAEPPRHALALALCLPLLACGGAPAAHHGASSKLGAAPLAPCPALPSGAEPLVEPGATVVLGETRGTRQAPAFAALLACDAAQRSSVIVGLDVPAALTPALRAYLASPGADADREALLAADFWASQDGRASAAMLDLVADLRALRERGKIIEVFGFATDADADAEGDGRDRRMARAVVAALRAEPDPRRVAIVLTGKQHARIDTERWMGWHVRDVFPATVALASSFRGGTAWTCGEHGCGVSELPGRPSEGSQHFVELGAAGDGQWSGRFYLDGATASAPVRPASDQQLAADTPVAARRGATDAYEAGDWQRAEELFLVAAEQAEPAQRAADYYQAARCAALDGRADAAFAALDAAVGAGLGNLGRVKVEADLSALHTDPRWQSVLAGVRRNDAELADTAPQPPGA